GIGRDHTARFRSATLSLGHLHRRAIVVVLLPNLERHTLLLFIVGARNLVGFRFRFRQRGEQHGCENRDDRDHNEQLNQRKRSDFLTESLHILFSVGYCFGNSPRTLENPFLLSTRFWNLLSTDSAIASFPGFPTDFCASFTRARGISTHCA